MTQDEIITMLATIGVAPDELRPTDWAGHVAVFHKFAELVAAKERERVFAAIKFHPSASHVSPDFRDLFNKTVDQQAAEMDAIRARGQKEGA